MPLKIAKLPNKKLDKALELLMAGRDWSDQDIFGQEGGNDQKRAIIQFQGCQIQPMPP